jgi:hypothetical protein
MGELGNVNCGLVGKPEGRKPLGSLGIGGGIILRCYLKNIICLA